MTKTQAAGLQKIAHGLIIFVICVYGLFVLQDILIPFIIAGLFSFLLFPVSNFFEKKGLNRVLSITITILLSVVFIGVATYFIISQILELESLIPIIEKKSVVWFSEFEKILRHNFRISHTQLISESQKYVTEILKNSTKVLSQTLSTTSNFLMNFSLLPLYIFLFLLYRDFLRTFIFKLMKTSSKHKISLTINKVNEVIKNYLVGLLLVILIVGLLNTTSLFILGIEHAIFFGFFAAVLVLIPYIGIAIGSALPIIVALITKDSYWYAVGVAGSFAAVQFLEGNFITPMVVGNKVSINSLIAIISLLLFGTLWGVSGLVLALPLTAILKVIFDSSEHLKAWGFLLGDADHKDVAETKKKFKLRF
ncbi:MAG: AI-2E family transporter [Spirosomataceae bacterium]|jgi:predicted PurR-regulated permease PerM|nr:AI-2E family transporter [Bacteroidota bacterium]